MDYYRINVKNEIQTLPAPLIYANPTQYASYYHTNAAGTLSQSIAESVDCPTYHVATCGYIIQTSQNTGGIVTDGLDLSASYMANLADLGKVRLGLHSQYVMDYRLQTYTGGPQLNLDGRFNQGFQPVIRYQQVLTAVGPTISLAQVWSTTTSRSTRTLRPTGVATLSTWAAIRYGMRTSVTRRSLVLNWLVVSITCSIPILHFPTKTKTGSPAITRCSRALSVAHTI